VVVLVLAGSVVLSLLIPCKPDTTMKVDLPPDYNLPLGEELPAPEPQKPEAAEQDQEPPQIKRA